MRIFAPPCHLQCVWGKQRSTEGSQCGFLSAECLLSLLLVMLRRSSHTSSRLGNNKKDKEDKTEDTVCLYPN